MQVTTPAERTLGDRLILYNLGMSEIAIHPLTEINPGLLRSLIIGYTSAEKYIVTKSESDQQAIFTLELQTLDQPYHKRWPMDQEMVDHYRSILDQGISVGLCHQNQWIGIAIAEKRAWNRSLWVWEFHIHPDYRREGLGRKMMNSLVDRARQSDCRVIVCETQNTNVPAIRFYRKVGFEIAGVDVSFYTNQDLTDFEVAIFMKRYVEP